MCNYSEFCGHQNDDVALTPSDVPTGNAAEYELEPAPKVTEEEDEEKPDNDGVEGATKAQPKTTGSGRRNHLVIFTVDISGSMNLTTEVPALQGI